MDQGFFARLRDYDRIAGIWAIGRRYFAMNGFDGAVTVIGVLAGAMTAGVDSPRIVLVTGFSTCLAMAISGLWGAYLTEAAERRRDLDELSRQTLTDLSKTQVGAASRAAVIIVALVDAASPLLAGSLALMPFLFAGRLASIEVAYAAGFAVALATLVGLGVFLGRVSRGSTLVYALKTLVAGVLAIGAGLVLRAV